ncbi:MAG: type I asparaginase [Alphaproteobacteria bacterium]|nr:type I asparaginase [Alphaproteobacteria bacterium]MCB9694288.1 type I asparaginase [Alphaproteobacteria bacterium]
MSRVCILHVGGTIGMALTERGWVPAAGFVERFLTSIDSQPSLPEWELHRLEPLLDSANMRPRDWVRIAEEVASRYDAFDGFVVLHGTDTMAYTSSALSFLLAGLGKHVVLTGAQLSLANVRSDGREHLVTSILLATLPIPEVTLYFGQRLLRGNRAQKIHNRDFVAFASGNFPPLARIGVGIDIDSDLIRPAGDGLHTVDMVKEPEVIAIRVYPGIQEPLLRRMLAAPVDGVILETYGTGTFPSEDAGMIRAIAEAIDRGVVVVNCSQCHSGRVQQGLYGTGRALQDIGVISGHDMTPEAALTKLYCLLAADRPLDVVRRKMELDLAGEISPA